MKYEMNAGELINVLRVVFKLALYLFDVVLILIERKMVERVRSEIEPVVYTGLHLFFREPHVGHSDGF